MSEIRPNIPVSGRRATQQRSKTTQRKIIFAAIEILADKGLAGLTHRAVAERAGVSLAATTYYYQAKTDMIADISNYLIEDYAEAIDDNPLDADGGRRLIFELILGAGEASRSALIAWMEIMFEAGRQPNDDASTCRWAPFLEKLCSKTSHVGDEVKLSHSDLDMMIGLFLMILALGLDKQSISAVFFDGADPFENWAKGKANEDSAAIKPRRLTSKAKATRQHILDMTISMIAEHGASAVNFRAVAKRAQLAPAAPAYYFASLQDLLREAQGEMFELAKARYKQTMGAVSYSTIDIDELIDLTTTVFFREATEFATLNLANYGICLEAARVPELRPMIWTAIDDQALAWYRVLSVLNADISPLDAFTIQAIYIGKLIRIVCSGSLTQDLAVVRKEFASDLSSLI